MLITSHQQASQMRRTILNNAETAKETLMKNMDTSALELFAAIKYEKIGVDPLTGRELNLIEQINQMYSDLVILAAVQELMEEFPGKSFEANFGAVPGYDVMSTDGQVVAECFAVTSVASNDKLNKDCRKLLKADAEHKYLFFYTYSDSDDKLEKKYQKYPKICFRRVY